MPLPMLDLKTLEFLQQNPELQKKAKQMVGEVPAYPSAPPPAEIAPMPVNQEALTQANIAANQAPPPLAPQPQLPEQVPEELSPDDPMFNMFVNRLEQSPEELFGMQRDEIDMMKQQLADYQAQPLQPDIGPMLNYASQFGRRDIFSPMTGFVKKEEMDLTKGYKAPESAAERAAQVAKMQQAITAAESGLTDDQIKLLYSMQGQQRSDTAGERLDYQKSKDDEKTISRAIERYKEKGASRISGTYSSLKKISEALAKLKTKDIPGFGQTGAMGKWFRVAATPEAKTLRRLVDGLITETGRAYSGVTVRDDEFAKYTKQLGADIQSGDKDLLAGLTEFKDKLADLALTHEAGEVGAIRPDLADVARSRYKANKLISPDDVVKIRFQPGGGNFKSVQEKAKELLNKQATGK